MMDKELIKQAIKELHQEGCFHIGCPWDAVSTEHIETLKSIEPLPPGAVKMVVVTWGVLSSFGKRVGQALAAGLFVVLCILIVLGAFGIGKVVQVCWQMWSK